MLGEAICNWSAKRKNTFCNTQMPDHQRFTDLLIPPAVTSLLPGFCKESRRFKTSPDRWSKWFTDSGLRRLFSV